MSLRVATKVLFGLVLCGLLATALAHVPRGWQDHATALAVEADGVTSTKSEKPRAAFGLDKRVPWTTSRIKGSPEPPPPYRTEPLFPHLQFGRAVEIATIPGSRRIVVVELKGKIVSFPDDQDCRQTDVMIDLAEHQLGFLRILGLVFHPDFVRNRYVYICYGLTEGDPQGTHVSRYTVLPTDPPTIDPASEKVIITWKSGGHNGGCLQFGPDKYLYISTGDGSNPSPPDTLDSGQSIDELLASILRIDVDGAGPEQGYLVPKDNPFVKMPGARPEVWAFGLRNPWKMAFNPKSGDLWVGDVGWELWEMVYRIERGGNYGWSVMEGRQPVRTEARRGPGPIIPPVVDHSHIEARSITGGVIYQGNKLPELAGAYIYGDYVTGKFWGLRYEDGKVTWHKHLADSALDIIGFGQAPDGEMLILSHAGTISRLVENVAAAGNREFPSQLSQTGLFTSVASHEPAPGVIPYSINAEPWADHSVNQRMIAIPATGRLGIYDKDNLQVGNVRGAWIYPSDTVLAKTVSLELERGNPNSRRRLETQILHRDGETWRAYTYVWNDEQTDAELAPANGMDRSFTIIDPNAPDGRRQQTWHFAARSECIVCHTTRAGSIHGFNVAQLNRDHDYGAVTSPQLATLNHLGMFAQSLPEAPPRQTDPADADADLNERARSYLHVNCAHCHRQGGGGNAPFQLRYDFELDKMKILGARPTQGTFGIPHAQVVAASDPYHSVLFYRMAKLGRGRMPYSGSNIVDEAGLRLIHDWIRSLPASAAGEEVASGNGNSPTSPSSALHEMEQLARQSPAEQALSIERLLRSTPLALAALAAVDAGGLPSLVREQLVARGAASPDSQIRDLFERFVPEDQRVRRLGAVVRPEEILSLFGSAEQGRKLYFEAQGVQCKNCHQIGGQGKAVGPELTQIGRKYTPAQLLDNILEPSKAIDPKFLTHLVETSAGRIHVGLLVERTEAQVTLRDAQGQLVTIPAGEVELVVPQQKSLMPDLQLRDMTAAEVADLLAFLSSLK